LPKTRGLSWALFDTPPPETCLAAKPGSERYGGVDQAYRWAAPK
jgi:hypothetical protein